MENSTKWSAIGGIVSIVAISLGFVSWYYQQHHETDNRNDEEQEEAIYPIPTEKSDVEVYAEVAKEGVELATEISERIRENKQRKDSIFKAEREQRWIFQIGDVANDKDEMLELYQQLKHINGLSVFKESGRSYFLFIEDGKSKQESQNSLENIKAQVLKATSRVIVIDLMSKCKKKEFVKKTKDLIFRKEKIEINCYECGKR